MQLRLVALLALAFVLYVVASVGAAGGALDVGVLALALVAAASALAPLWVGRGERTGAALVAALGIAQALAIAAYLARAVYALASEISCALTLPAAGLLVFVLAQRVPDEPPRLRKLPLLPAVGALALAAAALGVLSALPPLRFGGRTWIAPHAWSYAPPALVVACLVAALGLRLLRARLGSSASALAGSIWAALGIVAALLACALFGWLRWQGHALGSALSLASGAGALWLGHAWTLSSKRARVASAWAREAWSDSLALVCALGCAWLLTRQLGAPRGWFALPLLLAFVLARRLLRPLVRRRFSPHGGALLAAIDEASKQVAGAFDYADLAARLLKPLRRAASLPEAAPRLFSFDPARSAQLDAAGFARVRDQELPSVIMERLRRQPGEPIVASELSALLPRRPELAPLLRALESLDALCIVPLVFLEQLEGALLIARGARRAQLSLEELLAFERLAVQLAPIASGFLALERAHGRADRAEAERAQLRLSFEEQALQLAELSAQSAAIKAALGAPLSAREALHYSPSMRALTEQLQRLASHDLPLFLWAETGVALAPLAHSLHCVSGRGREPFVIVDCAALDRESALARLFGVGSGAGEQPGLCELIGSGTLLLTDVVALDRSVQHALAELLEERRIVPLNSHASHPFHGRLIVTAARPLDELVAASAMPAELARWFESTAQRVPPLRERAEDLESLLLLALDRAARVLGKPPLGVDAQALRALLEYAWPGNDAELASVIERAAARASARRITLADLPPFAGSGERLVLASYVEQEREILLRALKHAHGDRSRAARALGLKRALFVAKLRELEVDDPNTAQN